MSIPIAWESRAEIASALLDRYGMDYVFLGRIFQDRVNHQSCLIDILDYQKLDSSNNLATPVKRQNSPSKVVYLTSEDLGYDACLKMAEFAQLFLNVGGIEVKVNSTGIVRSKSQWLENYNSQDVFDIYSLFVTLIEADSYYYSCGMKNFGLADVSIDITEDAGLAIYVMNVFNYYRLTESVVLRDGQTFQPDIECPRYRMEWKEWQESAIDSLLYNPGGKWHLYRVFDDLDISYRLN